MEEFQFSELALVPSARADFRCPLAYRATVWGKQGQMEGVNTAPCRLTRSFRIFSAFDHSPAVCPPVTRGRGESFAASFLGGGKDMWRCVGGSFRESRENLRGTL